VSAESQRLAAELTGFLARKQAGLTLAVQANLTERTRRDTGWAANNWVPTLGRPYTSTVDPKTRLARLAALGSARAAVSSGIATVALAGAAILRGPSYVTNNVPYVPILNDRYDRQFIERAIEAGVAEAEKIR
jgi:hypothetical protein